MKKITFFLLGFLISLAIFTPAHAYQTYCVNMDDSYYGTKHRFTDLSVSDSGSFSSTPSYTTWGFYYVSSGKIYWRNTSGWKIYDDDGYNSSYTGYTCEELGYFSVVDISDPNNKETEYTTDPATCSNNVKDDDETGIDCGGSCSDECIISCPEFAVYTSCSDCSVDDDNYPGVCLYNAATETDGSCPDGYIYDDTDGGCDRFASDILYSDQDYIDNSEDNLSTETSGSISSVLTDYYETNPDTSGATTEISIVENEDGTYTTTTTKTNTNSDGSYSTTTTVINESSDGSSTSTTTTSNYSSTGSLTGSSTSTTSTDSDGNTTASSNESGDEAEDAEEDYDGIDYSIDYGEDTDYSSDITDDTPEELDLTQLFESFTDASPFSSIITGSTIETSGASCSLSFDYKGQTVEMGFCSDLATNTFDFMAPILVFTSTVFGIFIIFGKD